MTRIRYLVTGGAGFIGSHLCEALLAEGHEVYCIDDLSTGSIDNIKHLKEHSWFHYTIDTVMNRALTAELVDIADVVYHLAAAVGVKLIVESPVRTIETNVQATEMILALSAKKRRPTFIASTSEVYGKSADLPFREDGDLVIGPTTRGRWSYACSKALDEFLALAYWKEKKLPTVVGRMFNTVGPRQTGQYGMVVPSFIKQALAGEPITVYGDGEQSRCFCHVSDVVRALIALMRLPEAYGQVFNVGSDAEIKILELARQVKKTTRSSSEIVFIPYDEAYEQGFEDMRRRVPDLSKIGALIGWQPQIGLERILEEVNEYYQKRATGSAPSMPRSRLSKGEAK
jgi:UDP-glucose 4-epimerase